MSMQKIRDVDHRHLWDAYTLERTPEVKSKLIEAYFPLVQYLAQRMASTLPASVEVDDLVSMGTFGLIESIDRFDPARGIQFKTYCSGRIRGAILDNLRTNDWVPRLVRLRTNLVDKALRRLYSSTGREPTVPEVAGSMGLTVTAYEALRKEATPTTVLSLTDDNGEDAEGATNRMIDLVIDASSPDPHAAQQSRDVRDTLFRHLTAKEQTVVQYYYYEGLSMREIATMLKLTESRVCQIHSKVIGRLRAQHATRQAELFA
jgi:RNA polymerase sigma factor for flagellar operon FliA